MRRWIKSRGLSSPQRVQGHPQHLSGHGPCTPFCERILKSTLSRVRTGAALLLLQASPHVLSAQAGKDSTAHVLAYPHAARAYQLEAKGDFPGALTEMRAAIRLEPDEPAFRKQAVLLTFRLQDWDAALNECNAAMKAGVAGWPLLYRGLAQEKRGNAAAARTDLLSAIGTGSLAPEELVTARRTSATLALSVRDFAAALGFIDALSGAGSVAGDEQQLLLMRAQALEGLRRFEEANAAYSRAAAIANGASRTSALRAATEAARKSPSPNLARTALANELKAAPKDADVMRQLAEFEASQGRWNEAVEWIRKAGEVNPSLADTNFEIEALIRAGRTAEAYAEVSKRLEGVPPSERRRELLARRAGLALAEGETQRARADLLELLKLRPQSLEALRRLARIESLKGDVVSALSFIGQAVALKRDLDDLEFMANLQSQAGRHAEAAASFKIVLRGLKNPVNQRRMMLQIGQSEAAARHWAEAVKWFRQALEMEEDLVSRRNLATALEGNGKPEEALIELRKLPPTVQTAEVRLQMATLAAQAGRAAEAERDAVAAAPRLTSPRMRAAAYRMAGILQLERGDAAAAAASLMRASESGDKTPELWSALAQAAYSARLPRAAEFAAKAVSARRTQANVTLLARSYAQAGKFAPAEAAYQEAVSLGLPLWMARSELASVALRIEGPTRAAQLLREAAAVEGAPSAALLDRAAEHEIFMQDYERAFETLKRVRQMGRRDGSEQGRRLETLANVAEKLGRTADSIDYLQEALAAGAPVEERLGHLLASSGRCDQARNLFAREYQRQPRPEVALWAAQCSAQSGHLDQASQYWSLAEAGGSQLSDETRTSLYRLGGDLMQRGGELERAIESWSRALELSFDPELAIRMAETSLALKDFAQARASLDRVTRTGLDAPLAARYWRVQATVLEEAGESQAALEALAAIAPAAMDAEYEYTTARLHLRLRQTELAIQALRRANQARPSDALLARSLAYALREQGNLSEAATILRSTLAGDAAKPGDAAIWADLGYMSKSMGREREARESFRNAMRLVAAESKSAPWIRPAKAELAAMERRIHWDLAQGFVTGGLGAATLAGPGVGALLPSQGGAEVRWEPLGRLYQVFVRSYWASPANSPVPDANSLQGGAGIRFRPFRNVNAYFGAERLFPLGSFAFNGWLLRATYGSNSLERSGKSVPPVRPFYSTYADAAYLKAGPSTWLYQADTGLGLSFRASGVDISPYYLVSARFQDRFQDRRGYALHGAAISFRRRLECAEVCAFSVIEFTVSWRTGIARILSPAPITPAPFTYPSGWAFGTALGRE